MTKCAAYWRKVAEFKGKEDFEGFCAYCEYKLQKNGAYSPEAYDDWKVIDIIIQILGDILAIAKIPKEHMIPLIRERNDEVRDNVIQSIKKSLDEGKHPISGMFIKKDDIIRNLGDIIHESIKKAKEDLGIEEEREELPEGIFLFNVWSLFPKRIEGYGDGSFHGVTPIEVCKHTLQAYGNKEGFALDSMSGSGTFPDVAKELGYNCDRSDLRDGVDAREIDKPNGYYDLIFNHYPYWDMVKYYAGDNDLSLVKTKDEFLGAVKEIFKENYRLLKHNGFYCVMIGDQRKERTTSWLTIEFPKIAEEIGFITYDNAYIITIDNEHVSTGLAEYRAQKFNFMKPAVDWYLVFKKISKN